MQFLGGYQDPDYIQTLRATTAGRLDVQAETERRENLSPTERGAEYRNTLLAERQKNVSATYAILSAMEKDNLKKIAQSHILSHMVPTHVDLVSMLIQRLSQDPTMTNEYFLWQKDMPKSTSEGMAARRMVIDRLAREWKNKFFPDQPVGQEIMAPAPAPAISTTAIVVGGLAFFSIVGGIIFVIRRRQT